VKNRTYVGEFAKWDDVVGDYGGNCPADEPRYVFAEYQTPSYEGYSTVITSKDGRKFQVVEGSHCSCYGLEGQWEPTDHTVTELRKMTEATYGFFHDSKTELEKWLAHVRS
jgi:hypothetical protein